MASSSILCRIDEIKTLKVFFFDFPNTITSTDICVNLDKIPFKCIVPAGTSISVNFHPKVCNSHFWIGFSILTVARQIKDHFRQAISPCNIIPDFERVKQGNLKKRRKFNVRFFSFCWCFYLSTK